MKKSMAASYVERFKEHYEDAANAVFYDGREGGYQYVQGAGPCNPLDVLTEQFPDADPDSLKEAANTILSEGSAWVKRGRY